MISHHWISQSWITRRESHWRRLEFLVGKANRSLASLQGQELQELGLLYRQVAADLATVAEDPASVRLAANLNDLLGRCHNLLYQGEEKNPASLVQFFCYRYPELFRRMLPQTSLAAGLFLIASGVGSLLAGSNPSFVHLFLGPQMMQSIEHRRMWTESVVAVKPVASSYITTNNLAVAFCAFAMGVTGFGTAWMMFFNGLLLGVVAEATARAGMAQSLWSFVLPHGVLEIPAIWIAGGAGFELTRGLFFPGKLPRGYSLRQSGRAAVQLMSGCIPLLLMAGAIEAFFSPTRAPVPLKFSLAAILCVALVTYLFLLPSRQLSRSR